jgi:DNA topoisomerase-1
LIEPKISRSAVALELPPADPGESARAAGLRYVVDSRPGIRRRKRGTGFTYTDSQGNPLRDREQIHRIVKLAIPPAWTEVWICPSPRGHLQATGRDARGRKQYRYHPQWRVVRDETKYSRMIAFAEALPQIRRRVESDLARAGLPRAKVLAVVVKLLETTLIRVGNEEYARENRSFGLTTLRNRHVEITGATVRFEFRGKSGKEHAVEIHDRRVARIVRRCRDLPGHELFQYLDEEGTRQSVSSDDVNEYLREVTGEDFSAKDFRTWGGTVLALAELLAAGRGAHGAHGADDADDAGDAGEREAGRAVVEAVKRVAAELGNRPATCRKYYVHPAIIDSFLRGELSQVLGEAVAGASAAPRAGPSGLRRLERQALALIRAA